jgi:hypothetical protein
VTEPPDLLTATAEFPGDAAYAWWLNTHPRGYVLAVSPKDPPLLHRASCPEIDRTRHAKRLAAAGRRQICAEAPGALRAWVVRELQARAPWWPAVPSAGPDGSSRASGGRRPARGDTWRPCRSSDVARPNLDLVRDGGARGPPARPLRNTRVRSGTSVVHATTR